jgi:filamentous hemagglutinin family protein
MTQTESGRCWDLKLVIFLAINGVITSSVDFALAQITPDTSQGSESSLVTPLNSQINQIDGGARRGTNLFHSFQEFTVGEGKVVNFTNPARIENILSRVTGGSRSEILGKLSVLGGNANLFLINPNGIIFGPNASLDVRGSFVATTANTIQFSDQGFFSASALNSPGLLTVNPSALLFNQTTDGFIANSSRAPLLGLDPSDLSGVRRVFGLQVPDGRSLLLVGGDVSLDGGGLNALSGRVELGGLAGSGTVGLDVNGNNLRLSFPEGVARADVSLTNRARVNVSGAGGGDVQVQGRRVMLKGGSRILATTRGSRPGGDLVVTASDSIELIGPGISLTTETRGAGDAGAITLNTGKLIVLDAAQVLTSTFDEGSGGQLTVNASESVKLIGNPRPGSAPSGLFSTSVASGAAGNIKITTGRLLIQNGKVSAESSGRVGDSSTPVIPGTGAAGELIVNASESVKLINAFLLAGTVGFRNGGDLRITTGNLILQDGAEVSVSGTGEGAAGNLEVTANSIRLDNEGKLTATSASGEGGNIKLQDLDLLLLRDNSEISTTSRSTQRGGDITIDTDLLVGLENSDITANAFEGEGGFIQITAQGIFGLEVNETDTISKLRNNNTSDISAASQKDPSLNGEVEINRPEAESSSGLVTLPAELVDVSRLIAQGCGASGGHVARGASKFVATGRGGLPPTPTEALRSDAVLADLGTPVQSQDSASAASSNLTDSQPTPLVEAQGWVIGSKGEVVLTAQAPTITRIPWLTPTSCNVS